MRPGFRAIHRSSIGNAAATFSTAAGGRGRGIIPPSSDTTPAAKEDDSKPGLGHGRGTPIPPPLHTAHPFVATGRGRVPARQPQAETGHKSPIFFSKNDANGAGRGGPDQGAGRGQGRSPDVVGRNDLHLGIVSALGAGRGKVVREVGSVDQPQEEVKVENRHIRAKQAVKSDTDVQKEKGSRGSQKLSREEAVKNALGILSKGEAPGAAGQERRMEDGGGRGGGRGGFRGGFRGRGGRGRGFGGRGGRGRGGRDFQDKDDDFGSGLYLGDEADGEKLAKKLGPEKMDMLVEAFEEMSSRVLPSPAEDAYIDALHTNMMIECEPEYMMGEFDQNPDIDDTPPIPLRDAFEKMKPFLMAYENIQSHEEWEKVIEETMKTVPLMKEIVDHYCGPDRVTAMQQQKELRRVADTLPDRAHASVKRFTDRAILSLQSNPGWGFDKKCQFMDKLAWEVQQHYK